MPEHPQKKYRCEECSIRRRAETRPHSLLARLWRWHTAWCPGWKAYQEALRAEGLEQPPTSDPGGGASTEAGLAGMAPQ